MKKYIDCDGVILDTETGLFDRYYELKEKYSSMRKKEYLQQLDWYHWLRQVQILNDAIKILNNYDPKDVEILTKVHSLKEAQAKIEYFRSNNVKNNIIIVPDFLSKTRVVSASGNVLVDDSNTNLLEWDKADGYPLHFGKKDSIYTKIKSLDEVLNDKKIKKLDMKKFNF